MWGVMFEHQDINKKTKIYNTFKKNCELLKVKPYYVDRVCGFMISPTYDIPNEDLLEGLKRLETVIEESI